MKYSDIIVKSGVRQSFNIPSSYSNANISINNRAVTYTVHQAQDISISLVNAEGAEINNLFSGNASAGTHAVALPKSIVREPISSAWTMPREPFRHKFTIVK